MRRKRNFNLFTFYIYKIDTVKSKKSLLNISSYCREMFTKPQEYKKRYRIETGRLKESTQHNR